MTVVTHELGERSENTLTNLKAISSFAENRYHTCTKNMSDESEILALLQKIDFMVSENDPQCYSRPLGDEKKEQKNHLDHEDHKSPEDEMSELSGFHFNKEVEEETACEITSHAETEASEAESENERTTVEGDHAMSSVITTQTKEKEDEVNQNVQTTNIKCDPVNVPGDVEHSEELNDRITEEENSHIQSAKQFTTNETGVSDMDENKDKKDAVTEDSNAESLEDKERTTVEGHCEMSSDITSQTKEEEDEVEQNVQTTNIKCDPVNVPGDVEHSEELNDRITEEENSHIQSAKQFTTNKTGVSAMDENKDKKDAVTEDSAAESLENTERTTVEEHREMSSDITSQTKEKEDEVDQNVQTINLKCDPVNAPGDVEDEKKERITEEDNTEIQSAKQYATNKKVVSDMDGNLNKDPVKTSAEDEQRQTETETLLTRLDLQDKYEHKLMSAEFLKIGSSVKQDSNDTTEKDLAHTFLHRLMMLDYRVRYIPVKEDSTEMINFADDDFDEFWNATVNFDQSKQNNLHPLDVQMAVFHCSDSFLKQNMITKLSQCQYALPLLVPDPVTMDIECPLWTFRQIKKTWKKTETKDNSEVVTMNSMPICKAETPMVSFFRLGSLSVSKSQLMNTLINDRHNTFFHRDCPGSTKSRHLFDGVAEIAWYCPAGKPNDTFNDCVAFCNLHGDALTSETQRNILMQKCSVNVVLVPTLDKKHDSYAMISALFNSDKPLIILTADNDSDAVLTKNRNCKMGLKDRSLSDVSENLKRIIRNILSGPHESFQLDTMANVCGIRVDENDELCQKGKSAAMKILNLVKGVDVSKIKDTFLPCQGKLWHDWCKINKGLYHLKGNHLEEEKCKKKRELEKIRENQCTVPCSEVMKSFTESLSSLPPTEREYFLKWTQILVDALSTGDVSSILQNYHEKWSEILSLKKIQGNSDQLQTKQTELEQISTKLQSATFGLEHIFREMGQNYEAHECLHKPTLNKPTDWSKYPELAADLMISGYPMELMDGDAGHVPLTWISSLLDEVIKKLGDQRIFVLSVLGVQSSGKSTMLNAMFGLQFAVSAGRCTRGAFMQLVKVSDEKKTDFQFDYVLVVDTEGLRPLELVGNSTLHHDNELATFVVGVGNMTLINIFGENPAGMEDVLQIVVQAFMRMKKVKLSPSCVFVHQNVTDVAAVENTMDGKRRLQEKLDEMAQLAAKEEDCEAESFNDVISFDVKEDVKYFAQLWEGSPPMAPPNPGYSESIQDLKSLILSKASQSVGVTLSEFKTKVQDLWNALMNENFVFSFKNTREIAVYRKLEVQYGNWTWELRSKMLIIENQLHNRIENGKHDQIELSYLSKEMSKKYEEVKTTMTFYFDDDKDKEILAQWRGQFKIRIKEFHDEQVRRLKKKLNEVIQQKVACKKLDEKKTKFENELLQKSKELALQLKDKVNDEEELEHQFNCVWKDWVSELTRDIKPIEDIKLEEEQFKILHELGIEEKHINESRSSDSYKNISELGDYSGYLKQKKFEISKCFLKQSFQHDNQQIWNLIKNVEEQALDEIKRKPVATRGYSPMFLQEVAKTVKDEVTEFDSQWRYALKKKFTVDLLLYVFDRAEPCLLESHKKFKINNDAHTYLESKKGEYYSVFRSFCKENSSAVVLGELICEKLKGSIVEAVCTKTAIDLAGEMRCSFPAFNGNRLNLEKHVLKSLAEKENFEDYITYIYQPRRHVENFIEGEVNKYIYIDHREKAQNILKKNVDDIENQISRALSVATEEVKTQQGDLEMWLQEFSSLLKDVLAFSSINSENFIDVKDFDFLKKGIEKRLIPVFEDMKKLSLDKMRAFRRQPDQILIEQLCDCCWETCPFCTAVCTNTIKDHSPDKHSVPFHRPSGINGWHFRGTEKLCVNFCTTNVASDCKFYPRRDSEELIPYKSYYTAGGKYETWLITADGSNLPYWKWFLCRFQKNLEKKFEKKFEGSGEIPSDWREYTKEEAIQSLDEMYK